LSLGSRKVRLLSGLLLVRPTFGSGSADLRCPTALRHTALATCLESTLSACCESRSITLGARRLAKAIRLQRQAAGASCHEESILQVEPDES